MSDSKVVLITGSSSGFGFMAAKQLADKGNVVYAGMRGCEGKNAGAAKELELSSDNITVVELELSSTEQVSSVIDQIMLEQGRIYVVINNAGVMNVGVTEGYTEEQHYKQMEANYFGPVRMFRAVLPYMRKAKSGLFITVTSIAGRMIFPAFTSYNSSKYAAEALAEGYRYELAPFNIDSVIIEPGPFSSNLIDNSPKPADQTRVHEYGEHGSRLEGVLGGFEAFISGNSGSATNPQVVVDDILNLIEMPHGTRPLRTVSGEFDYGARELNKITASIQSNVITAMQMEDLDV